MPGSTIEWPLTTDHASAACRTLLLLALVLLVLAVVGLFLFGRAGQRPTRPSRRSGETPRPAEGVTLIGEDFDYTFTERERPIFRIRGDSIRADREDTLFLDGVGLTFYDETRAGPTTWRASEASFNRASNEGRLRGNVLLKGPSDLELRAAVLQLRERGRVLISPRPVWIGFAKTYATTAQRMRVYIPDEIYVLEGRVNVTSVEGVTPPVHLKSERAIYERAQRLLRIEQNVELDRGPEHIQAQKLNAQLSADEKSLSYLQALGGVSGRLRRQTGGPSGQAETVIRFAGEELTIQFEPGAAGGQPGQSGPAQAAGDVRKIELDSKGGEGGGSRSRRRGPAPPAR